MSKTNSTPVFKYRYGEVTKPKPKQQEYKTFQYRPILKEMNNGINI